MARRADAPSDEAIIEAEQLAHRTVVEALERSLDAYRRRARFLAEVRDDYVNHVPRQRGRGFTGECVPMSDAEERSLLGLMIPQLQALGADPGFSLPAGPDAGLLLPPAYLAPDVKLLGPTDSRTNIVLSPNQLSGDGRLDKHGRVLNSPVHYGGRGRRKAGVVYPRLAPFFRTAKPLITVTSFVVARYAVAGYADHRTTGFEVATVPNGLLLTGVYSDAVSRLLGRGKDDASKRAEDKRVRVYLQPLAELGEWRLTRIPLDT